jgi:glutathione peroxidase
MLLDRRGIMTTKSSVSLALMGAMAIAACGASKDPGTPVGVSTATGSAATTGFNMANPHSPIYDLTEKDIDGQDVKLSAYAGKVILVVNVASKCGFTPQYQGLEALYEKHKDEGLVLLGFPSDQFGDQEPGTESEIKTFCTTRYAVKFPLFSKIDVNGEKADPLYRMLRAEAPSTLSSSTPGGEKLYEHLAQSQPDLLGNDSVKWNFTKFLVSRDGKIMKRFESPETPEKIEPEIVAQLHQK